MKPRTEIPWRIKLRLMLECSVVGRHIGTLIAIGAPPLMLAAGPVFLEPFIGGVGTWAIVMGVCMSAGVYLAIRQ